MSLYVIVFLLGGGQIAFEPGILNGGRVPTYTLEQCELRREIIRATIKRDTVCMTMDGAQP